MISQNIFNVIFVIPTLNLLALFLLIFNSVGLPGAFGFAIVALVLVVRAILHPFFVKQMETQKKMQNIKPHLDKIQAKHKKDPKRLQEEQMRLYKEHGLNPAAGCLPMLIQLPVFFGLYTTLDLFLKDGSSVKAIGEINKVLYSKAIHIQKLDPMFFGFNLALTPQKAGEWHYYLMPVITGLLQYAQTRYASPIGTPAEDPVAVKKEDKKLAKAGAREEEKKSDNMGDFQKALNVQMKYFFPIMIAYFSFILPVGLSLYWNIFAIFSILQYRRVNKN